MAAPVGWVIETYEDGSVDWWQHEQGWVDDLQAATIFTDEEHGNYHLPFNGTWQEVFTHGGGDLLSTEECPGVDTCPDCLDAARSVS